jgi:hypothetical protein
MHHPAIDLVATKQHLTYRTSAVSIRIEFQSFLGVQHKLCRQKKIAGRESPIEGKPGQLP